MDFNAFENSLTEVEMALFIGVTMAMHSAIEAGGDQASLLERISTHEKNFQVRGQDKASSTMTAFKMMVQSTLPK